jgi:type IV pilus assembly protein PilA
MKKFFKSFKKGQKGFTLIELLIVIVILGVLAAAIIPNLSKFIGSGTVGAANAELASVRTATAAYQTDHDGSLPTADGTGGDVVPASIAEYITGSAGLKATYTLLDDGTVDAADPGDPASATAWGPGIEYVEGKWQKS